MAATAHLSELQAQVLSGLNIVAILAILTVAYILFSLVWRILSSTIGSACHMLLFALFAAAAYVVLIDPKALDEAQIKAARKAAQGLLKQIEALLLEVTKKYF